MNLGMLGNAKKGKAGERRRTVRKAFAVVVVFAAALLLVGTMATPLCAQSYPNKPVRLMLPFPPGGATDVLGRLVGQKYAERFGQPFVPENRPGAGGNIGTELAAKAPPDGYTIVFVSPSMTISPNIYKKLNYDATRDLAAISMVMDSYYVLLVRNSLPVKSLKELIEYAKARPGEVNYGAGIGTPPHLAGVLMNKLANIQMTHVPYKGVAQAMVGLMSNEIDVVMIGTPAALPQIAAGKVRALAVLSKERLPSLPDVPTTGEAGLPGYIVQSWYGVMAPAGTPRDIITLLNKEWAKIAVMPDTIAQTRKFGFEPMHTTPEVFAQFIKEDIVNWGKIVKAANLTAQ
jgi:tripartite-type tricarboxylate transporter receptor subunit TctC